MKQPRTPTIRTSTSRHKKQNTQVTKQTRASTNATVTMASQPNEPTDNKEKDPAKQILLSVSEIFRSRCLQRYQAKGLIDLIVEATPGDRANTPFRTDDLAQLIGELIREFPSNQADILVPYIETYLQRLPKVATTSTTTTEPQTQTTQTNTVTPLQQQTGRTAARTNTTTDQHNTPDPNNSQNPFQTPHRSHYKSPNPVPANTQQHHKRSPTASNETTAKRARHLAPEQRQQRDKLRRHLKPYLTNDYVRELTPQPKPSTCDIQPTVAPIQHTMYDVYGCRAASNLELRPFPDFHPLKRAFQAAAWLLGAPESEINSYTTVPVDHYHSHHTLPPEHCNKKTNDLDLDHLQDHYETVPLDTSVTLERLITAADNWTETYQNADLALHCCFPIIVEVVTNAKATETHFTYRSDGSKKVVTTQARTSIAVLHPPTNSAIMCEDRTDRPTAKKAAQVIQWGQKTVSNATKSPAAFARSIGSKFVLDNLPTNPTPYSDTNRKSIRLITAWSIRPIIKRPATGP